jgi:nicotinate phosphoribosyltransferase
VFRVRSSDGRAESDTVALATEQYGGEPLLRPVMRAGQRVAAAEPLEQIRARVAEQLAQLPVAHRSLDPAAVPYPVQFSSGLRELTKAVDAATA